MDQPMTLIDAQVHFLAERLALVHIPLDLYPYFLQSVLRLVFDELSPLEDGNEKEESRQGDDDDADDNDNNDDHSESGYTPSAFLNISITPVEVSVICPRRLVDKYFAPLRQQLNELDESLDSQLDFSDNDYIAMQVIGQGLEAGKRVLELTSPLAMAGISIFFISTYFSDYIVFPLHSKSSVVSALESRGFQFQESTAAFINPISPTSPRPDSEKRLSEIIPPGTPPPSTISELQMRTFENLRKRQVTPYVDETLRLVQCAAHHQFEYGSEESSMSILRDALTAVLVVDSPRDSSSRFEQPSGLHKHYETGSSLLLGSKEDYLIPIMLDLRDLPLEASGIVCGVAGRLADAPETKSSPKGAEPSIASSNDSSAVGSVPALFNSFGARLNLDGNRSSEKKTSKGTHSLAPTHHLKPDVDPSADMFEISFLSTARAGTIIVGEDELQRAMDALEAEKVQESIILAPEDEE
ncbi:uncharacterized protein N7469_002824 [Penicillium citrinum]|uniref:CASTOR ACT domain-containing protein n=1 Tax=Penicillium citrinum TaxID=5077 RepID=A0A9W9PB16_PENCI|nr:uncharacterized protein N7469_002824 [Penicillium citrinum]KAJ5241233.1 hypothetical protein N7469_002824 [Penicillium citrinum]